MPDGSADIDDQITLDGLRHSRLDSLSLMDQAEFISEWHILFVRNHRRSFPRMHEFFQAFCIRRAKDIEPISRARLFRYLAKLDSLEKMIMEDEIFRLLRLPAWSPLGEVFSPKDDLSKEEIDAQYIEEVSKQDTLLGHFTLCLNSEKKRVREIVSARIGLDGAESLTLEEVASGLSITRERVRQIEKKFFTKTERSAVWDDYLREKLAEYLDLHGGAIYLSTLIETDDWFEGLDRQSHLLVFFLKYFAFKEYAAERDRNGEIFIRQKDCDVRSVDYRSTNDNLVDSPPVLDIYKIAETFQKMGAVSVHELVRRTLAESSEPVTAEDVYANAIRLGMNIDPGKMPSIKNALVAEGIMLDKKHWGTRRHLEVSDVELASICNDVYDFCTKTYSVDRIFHADETIRWMEKRGKLKLLKYGARSLVGMLRYDPLDRFRTKKLLFWLREFYGDERPPTQEEQIAEILRLYGESGLTANEIKFYLNEKRAMSKYFQIHVSDKYLQGADQKWRLIE